MDIVCTGTCTAIQFPVKVDSIDWSPGWSSGNLADHYNSTES